MSGSAHISDLAKRLGGGPRWAMVRYHFGISSFGVNAYVADEAGTEVISEHDEIGPRSGRHEELYFVADGHATFTVNGEEVDAPPGTFVFVRDPAAKRKAVAKVGGTTILIAGATPGVAFTPSTWERQGPVLAYFADEEYDKAIEELERLRAETPEDPTVLYNLACAFAQTGRKAEALDLLRQAVDIDSDFGDNAKNDPDFDAIRDDPEFASAIAGKVQAGRSSS
jgi:tetratricopeptide (TPR) repeat protein